jgi:hypothetical protein
VANEREKTVFIGCGAGFAGDRFDAAVPVVRHLAAQPGPRYLIFECLAERTLALAQAERARDPERGYSVFLDRYFRPILAGALANGVRIVTNLGAANPAAGARRVQALARELGLAPPPVAVVTGDDLRATLSDAEIRALPRFDGDAAFDRPITAANTYLGAAPVRDAVATGGEVVLVGRTTDSALVLGPLMHEFGWSEAELDRLAAGTICGHVLECGAQVTGAYFADPGFKDVPDLAHVGFPVAEVAADGSFIVTKPADTGGLVSRATVTEQLLYEMHDPAAYLVPDATCDITGVRLSDKGPNRTAVAGVHGHAPPPELKATVCVENGWMAEAEMSYAGPNGAARAELAGQVVETRLREQGVTEPIGIDLIGAGAALDPGHRGRTLGHSPTFDGDYRLRMAMIAESRDRAALLIDELQSLYCSGPAGGGGFRSHLTAQTATGSVMVPHEVVGKMIRVEVVRP